MNYTIFSSAHRNFSRIDHILGHKSSLDKFKKMEIIPSIFSDRNALRLDLNYRKKTIKNSNIWRLNNTLLNNQQFTEEIKKRKSKYALVQFSSVAQSCPTLCDLMNHSMPPYPSLSPGVQPNSCSSSW